MGHGRGALLTHGIVEREPSLVRRALWYSPSIGLATILRRVLERSVSEGRLYERFRSSMALEFGDSLGA